MRFSTSIVLLAVLACPLCGQENRGAEVERLAAAVLRLYQEGKFMEAVPLAQRALELTEALGEARSDTVILLNTLALLYEKQGAYRSAEPLLQRVLAIREKTRGPEDPDVATAGTTLAYVYHWEGEYDKAEVLFRRVLAIRETKLGPEHPDTATSLGNLASVYEARAAYTLAEPLFQRALAIREKVLGPTNPEIANSLNSLATMYFSKGTYDQAEPLLQRALAIQEKSLGPDHADSLVTVNNLAELYRAQGAYSRAEPLYQRALEARERTLGPEHLSTAFSLGSLAELYRTEGAYSKAEPLFKRALAIFEKTVGVEHPDTATSLNNLASMYFEQGTYGQAEPLLERSLAINEKRLGPEHPATANSLNSLAVLYKAQGEYSKAEALFKRALSIREKMLGPEHPATANSLNNVAAMYFEQHAYDQAEPLLQRALAINEKRLGSEHPVTATSLNSLGELYREEGAYDRAEPLLRRALTINEKSLGPDHPETLIVVQNLGAMLAERGNEADWAGAESLIGRGLSSDRERNLIAFGKRTEQRSVLDRRLVLFSVLAAKVPPNSARVDSWRMLLLKAALTGKARTVDELRAAIEAAANSADSHLLLLTRDVKEAWQEISALDSRGPEGMGLIPYRDNMVQLYRREEDLLDQLSAASAAVRDARQVESETVPESIASKLRSGDALVEVVQYAEWIPVTERKQHKPRALYGAVILYAAADRTEAKVDWVELGEAEMIDKLVTRYLQSVRTADNDDVSHQMQAALRQAVWKKITNAAGRRRRMLISPDRSLRLIPWNIMLEDKPDDPELVMMTSGRDVVRWDQEEPSRGADVVTGISRFGDAGLGSELTFRDLPSVEKEVAAVRDALGLAQSQGEPVTKLWLLTTVNSPRVLHLATHGYYQGGMYTDDPMLRAGIALEKANEHGGEGRLTAKEAAGLNLRGTQLATLSACQTGVGESNFADGLLGLQRSLTVAGARSQLLTLWPVNDVKTKEFMQAFYQRLANGEGKAEALRMVQREMQAKGEPQHYWAPFVLYGEPGPIQ